MCEFAEIVVSGSDHELISSGKIRTLARVSSTTIKAPLAPLREALLGFRERHAVLDG